MSTKDILSEGELDALMDSVSSGDVPLDAGGDDAGCKLFDFSTREQALLAQMPALKTINEKLILALGQGIYDSFKMPAEVTIGETRLIKMEEVLASIAEPAGINLVSISPLNGTSLVLLPAELLSFFVDRYFGGSSSVASAGAARENLTPTERRINDVLTEKFLATLQEAWRETVSLTSELLAFETNPDFLPALPTEDLALRFCFEITVSDWQSSIDWVVPYAALEPLRGKLGNPAKSIQPQPGGADWEAYFRRELLGVDIEVSGLFTSRNVSLGDVLSLKPGSIVPLKAPSEVTLCIEGQPFSSGEHGVLNGQKSIKISEIFIHEASGS